MKKLHSIFAVCAALALLIAYAVFTASAATTVTPSNETYTTSSTCPHCGKAVDSWTPITTLETNIVTASGHYVVEAGTTLTLGKTASIGANASDVAILVVGNIAFTDAGHLRVGNMGTTNTWLIGGGGIISGGNTPGSAVNPSVIGLYDNGTLNIIGNITIQGNETEAITANRGGVINVYNKGKVYMYGGTINGFNLASANTGSYAGVYLRNGGDFYMYGGTINGGSSASGPAVYVANGSFVMEGGTVNGGNATASGGTLYISEGTIDINGGTVNGGEAPNGGNIYLTSGTLTMTGGTVTGGTARNNGNGADYGHGGCIYVKAGTATFQGGTLSGGKTIRAKDSGGTNRGGNGGTIYAGGTVNLSGTTVNGGTCYIGAAFYIPSGGTVNMTAGTVTSGTASSQGQVAGVYSGTFNMSGGTIHNKVLGDSGIRVQGSAKVYLHGNALVKGGAGNRDAFDFVGTTSTPATLVLAGNARIGDLDGKQTATHNTLFQSYTNTSTNTTYYPRLQVANDWTGFATISDNFGSTAAGTYILAVPADAPTKFYAQCGTWDAKNLTFTQGGAFESDRLVHSTTDEGNLPIFGEDGKLMLPRAKAVVNGTTSWFRLSDQAVDATYQGGYTVLYKDDPTPITIPAGKTACVDFNGFIATVTGEGTLQGIDSSALATGTGKSQITFEGVQVPTLAVNPVTGENFVAIKDGSSATFHAVTANIVSATIRPETVSLYYTASFVCDDIIKPYLNNYGVAVSLKNMPGEDYAQDSDTMFTSMDPANLESGAQNSVLITGIMKQTLEAAVNKGRGEMPVYANAYMKLTIDGEEIVIMANDTAEHSLKSLLTEVNTYWDTFAETAQDSLATQIYDPYMRNFEGGDWDIYNLRIHANGGYTPEEETILAQRRQTVMDYMRESVSLLWRSDKTLTYGLGNTERDNGASFTIVEGRLYKGLPYVYGAGTQDAFLEYAGQKDEHGIYTITGLAATALNYESYGGRVGNDCSGAVTNAWSLISPTITGTTSSTCSPYFGIVPVGNYAFNSPIDPNTHRILDTKYVVDTNGEQVMYEAYAMLQPADAAYHQEYPSTKGNHIRMVVSVNVVRNADGTIDGTNSTITMLEQTRTQINANKTETHPVTGETIYVIGGVDKTYKFSTLFGEHYIPVTIKELRDPSPVEETWVDDTLEVDTIDNLFTGSVITNRYLDSVRITIYNEAGEIVQQSTGRRSRSVVKEYKMERFLTEKPGSMKGNLDLDALEAGNYRCTVTVKLTIDDDYVHTARDFTFSK